ncbi:hypothetical protein AS156_19995 [Bradyrhizobium macuxiense]|uniref:Uncharacterized protein n=1 Tax=Bradyrhizobium macuxiense TaxID=1755647 RepID=A0A120FI89_9BRAD|nr:hypothetical protein AS156_19995 [Bradyrhizobium macuxiense]
MERDGLFAGWMRDNAVGAVIVRPDRYIFAAAADADELNRLVGQLLQTFNAGRASLEPTRVTS